MLVIMDIPETLGSADPNIDGHVPSLKDRRYAHIVENGGIDVNESVQTRRLFAKPFSVRRTNRGTVR